MLSLKKLPSNLDSTEILIPFVICCINLLYWNFYFKYKEVYEKFGYEKSLIACYFIAGLSCYISPYTLSIYFAGIAYFVMGLSNNSARIIIRTIFMEVIPNNIMGRVQTIFGVYTRIMMLLSVLTAGWLTENYNAFIGMNFASIHYLIALLGIIFLANYSKFNKEIFSK